MAAVVMVEVVIRINLIKCIPGGSICDDSTLQQSVLCKFLFLFLPGIPKMPLDMSKGLNMILFISKIYGGFFL